VLNSTFNNISAISWQSVLLVEETRALTPINQSINATHVLPQENTNNPS